MTPQEQIFQAFGRARVDLPRHQSIIAGVQARVVVEDGTISHALDERGMIVVTPDGQVATSADDIVAAHRLSHPEDFAPAEPDPAVVDRPLAADNLTASLMRRRAEMRAAEASQPSASGSPVTGSLGSLTAALHALNNGDPTPLERFEQAKRGAL